MNGCKNGGREALVCRILTFNHLRISHERCRWTAPDRSENISHKLAKTVAIPRNRADHPSQHHRRNWSLFEYLTSTYFNYLQQTPQLLEVLQCSSDPTQVSEIFQGEGVRLLIQIHELATMLEQEGQLSSRPVRRWDVRVEET